MDSDSDGHELEAVNRPKSKKVVAFEEEEEVEVEEVEELSAEEEHRARPSKLQQSYVAMLCLYSSMTDIIHFFMHIGMYLLGHPRVYNLPPLLQHLSQVSQCLLKGKGRRELVRLLRNVRRHL